MNEEFELEGETQLVVKKPRTKARAKRSKTHSKWNKLRRKVILDSEETKESEKPVTTLEQQSSVAPVTTENLIEPKEEEIDWSSLNFSKYFLELDQQRKTRGKRKLQLK